MSTSEDFCLKWNDHHSIFFSSAEDLCQKDNLTDVTLSCGSKLFSAHKLVLSVCSSYFSSLFARGGFRGQQTVVYLKDVDPRHMELLLSYMYRGEINVQEQELMGLLATAKGLQIKGLTEANDTGDRQTKTKSITPVATTSNSASSSSSTMKRSLPPSNAGPSKVKRPSSHSEEQPDQKKIKEEVWHGDGTAEAGGAGVQYPEEDLEGPLEDDYGGEGYDMENTGDDFPIPEGGGPMIYEDNDQNMSSVPSTPTKCQVCDKTFTSDSNLVMHSVIHQFQLSSGGAAFNHKNEFRKKRYLHEVNKAKKNYYQLFYKLTQACNTIRTILSLAPRRLTFAVSVKRPRSNARTIAMRIFERCMVSERWLKSKVLRFRSRIKITREF